MSDAYFGGCSGYESYVLGQINWRFRWSIVFIYAIGWEDSK